MADFTVGHRDFGSVRFIGHTDVRGLDLDAIVRITNRSVTVYLTPETTPPVGSGLNKSAEITLRNCKPKAREAMPQYVARLRAHAQQLDADFIGYDELRQEFKFRVAHFTTYALDDDEDDEVATQQQQQQQAHDDHSDGDGDADQDDNRDDEDDDDQAENDDRDDDDDEDDMIPVDDFDDEAPPNVAFDHEADESDASYDQEGDDEEYKEDQLLRQRRQV